MTGHQIMKPGEALKFMLAGKATVTLKSAKSGEHLTYRINKPKPNKTKTGGPTHFVKVRTGNDFAYLGFFGSEGKFIHGRNADLPFDSQQSRAFAWTIAKLQANQLPEKLEVWHEGQCGRCGRALQDPESIARGIGPECIKKME